MRPDRGTVVIGTFCRSAQNRPNAPFRSDMAAKLARLGVNFGQQGPNFGPTCTHLTQTSPQLGSKMAQLGPNLDPEQLRPKLRSIWPRTARFDPSRLWLASTPAPFLSIQFSGRWRLSSWSDLNKRIILRTDTLHTTSHVYSNYTAYII